MVGEGGKVSRMRMDMVEIRECIWVGIGLEMHWGKFAERENSLARRVLVVAISTIFSFTKFIQRFTIKKAGNLIH